MAEKPLVTIKEVGAFLDIISELHHIELMCARFLHGGAVYEDNKVELLSRLDHIKVKVGRITPSKD